MSSAVGDQSGATKPLGRRLRERFAGIGLEDELPELRGEVAQPALFGTASRTRTGRERRTTTPRARRREHRDVDGSVLPGDERRRRAAHGQDDAGRPEGDQETNARPGAKPRRDRRGSGPRDDDEPSRIMESAPAESSLFDTNPLAPLRSIRRP